MEAIAERSKQEKAEQKAKQDQDKVTDIATDVVAIMTEDQMPQSEIVGLFRERSSKSKAGAYDALVVPA